MTPASHASHATAAPQATRRGDGLLLAGGAAALLAALAWYVHLVYSHPGMWSFPLDLTVYRDAGLIVRHVRPYYHPHLASPLLDWPGPPGYAGIKFIYPPFAALPFAFLSLLPLRTLQIAATWAGVAAVLVTEAAMLRALGQPRGARRAGLVLLTSAAALMLEPVQRTLYLGQVELVLMALVTWDMCQPERRWWQGAGVGIAAGIKMVPLIFIPYLLLTRRFRQAAVAAAVFAATVAVGFVLLPRDSSQWWLHGLFARGSYSGNVTYAGNQSLLAVIARAGGSHTEWLAAAVLTGMLGLAAAAALDRAGHRPLGFAMTALTGLLVSPISWDHHWVWIVLAAPVLVCYGQAARGAARWACWGAGALVLAVFGAWPTSLWGELTDPSGWDRGVIWAPPNGSGQEAHWHGLQLLAGNAYVLTGVALFVVLAVAAAVLARRPRLAARAAADS
ncbi:MAG: glycosyltransferase 87 family protein [Streptosporangiales bacterium]